MENYITQYRYKKKFPHLFFNLGNYYSSIIFFNKFGLSTKLGLSAEGKTDISFFIERLD